MGGIHLFEPSGYAGVFRHACRLGELLGGRGLSVTLHTGHEHEPTRADGVAVCACSWWPRGPRSAARLTAISARFLASNLPHLRRAVSRGGVLHVQGIAAGGALTTLALAAGRVAGRRIVYSPHDTFSRRGRLDALLLRGARHVPHAIVVHSEADVTVLRGVRAPVHLAPLVQLVPRPSEDRRRRWRAEWGAEPDDEVVLFAGVVRPEKRLDLLIESAAAWPAGRRLAVVGQDRGAWAACAGLGRSRGVDVAARVEFVPLEDFTAAIAAADLVVAPHDRASQSGVLSLAGQLGVPSVAADVGGLGELASRNVRRRRRGPPHPGGRGGAGASRQSARPSR